MPLCPGAGSQAQPASQSSRCVLAVPSALPITASKKDPVCRTAPGLKWPQGWLRANLQGSTAQLHLLRGTPEMAAYGTCREPWPTRWTLPRLLQPRGGAECVGGRSGYLRCCWNRAAVNLSHKAPKCNPHHHHAAVRQSTAALQTGINASWKERDTETETETDRHRE